MSEVWNVELIEEMKNHLPIPVYPTGELCKILGKQGRKIGIDTKLMISKVFDLREEGGIGCSVIEENSEIFVVSLTYLRPELNHPLAGKILAYQKKRTRSIAGSKGCYMLKR